MNQSSSVHMPVGVLLLSAAFGACAIWAILVPVGVPVRVAAALLAVASAAGSYLLLKRSGRQAQGQAGGRAGDDATNYLSIDAANIDALMKASLDSESAGRKLAAQVGETLSATAAISSQTMSATERVRGLSEQVSSGASALEEIFRAVESLASRIGAQENLVAQSAAAIEEMSASIAGVASIAAARTKAAQDLRDTTEKGSGAVGTTERAMNEVSESVAAVKGMIQVIDDIASRTNLLAINAAIEAAHAGNSGQGFAVVASEVRKLAESASTNAAQISERLSSLIERIGEAREASTLTGDAFREIRKGVAEVTDAFAEITASTAELSTGTYEVVAATESLRDISAEIAGSADEMKVGAGDVTTAISTTRDAAHDTVEAMSVINEASGNVTDAINKITDLSVASIDQTGILINWVAEIDAENQAEAQSDAAEATDRLRIATIILQHLGWVGRVRALLDGRQRIAAEELVDHTQCDLGRWLADDDVGRKMRTRRKGRLVEVHTTLHRQLREIVESPNDRENRFLALLTSSREIVEILTALQGGAFVRWTPDFSVQVDLFDSHHKRLFGLIDALHTALQTGHSREQLEGTMDELVAYTTYHFSAEERAFEAYDYPYRDTQIAQHQEFVRRVGEMQGDLASGKSMVAVEVTEFLRDWLVNHIKGCDVRYGDYLNGKDLSMLEAGIASGQEIGEPTTNLRR